MSWLLSSLGCAVLYGLMLSSTKPADLIAGAVIGAVLAALAGPPRLRLDWLARIAWSPVFAFGVVVQIAQGSFVVAKAILGRRSAQHDGLVEVPASHETDAGAVVAGLVASLSPGALLVRFDREREVLVFHLLDARDPDQFRARQASFYQRYQRRVVP